MMSFEEKSFKIEGVNCIFFHATQTMSTEFNPFHLKRVLLAKDVNEDKF